MAWHVIGDWSSFLRLNPLNLPMQAVSWRAWRLRVMRGVFFFISLAVLIFMGFLSSALLFLVHCVMVTNEHIYLSTQGQEGIWYGRQNIGQYPWHGVVSPMRFNTPLSFMGVSAVFDDSLPLFDYDVYAIALSFVLYVYNV